MRGDGVAHQGHDHLADLALLIFLIEVALLVDRFMLYVEDAFAVEHDGGGE